MKPGVAERPTTIVEDYVCVDQATKDQVAIDNAQAQSRIAGS